MPPGGRLPSWQPSHELFRFSYVRFISEQSEHPVSYVRPVRGYGS